MKNLIKLTVLALVVACFSGYSTAKGNGANRGAQMPSFNEIDINRDSLISAAEFNEFRVIRQSQKKAEGRLLKNADPKVDMFESIDTDGDGMISIDEFTNHQLTRRKVKRNTW